MENPVLWLYVNAEKLNPNDLVYNIEACFFHMVCGGLVEGSRHSDLKKSASNIPGQRNLSQGRRVGENPVFFFLKIGIENCLEIRT